MAKRTLSSKNKKLLINSDNLFFLGGLTGAEAVSGGGALAGGLSGIINTKSQAGGAASGALKGASMGAMLGPYGMAAGALIGGTAGLISAGKQQKEAEFADMTNSMSERNSLLEIKANGGYIVPQGISPNMMSEYAEGGMIKKSYNPALAKSDIGFQSWYNKNTLEGQANIPYSDDQVYDYLSFYKNKEHLNPDYNIDQHFPDTYKRPSHPTFSNESIYSTPRNPGGSWNGENYNKNGKFMYAEGGLLTEFGAGGSHESSPTQGIQQGVDPNGQQNKVEEGETKYQDYIFSDRLLIDKQAVQEHNLPKTMIGKSFADASKIVSKLHKERPNDPITRDTMRDKMNHLMQANDEIREYEEGNMLAMGGNLYPWGSQMNVLKRKEANGVNTGGFKLPPQNIESQKLFDNAKSIMANGANSDESLPFFKDPKNLRYAPIAFDALAATGLLGKTPKPEQYSPSLIQQQGYLAPQQADEQSMRNAIDASYGTGVNALSEASGGSGAALRANLSGLNSDYMSAIGKGYSSVNQANIGQKQAADQFNLSTQGQVAGQNAQLVNHAGIYNNQLMNQNRAQDWDTRMSYLAKGAEGLGDIGYEARNAELMPRLFGYNQRGEYRPLNAKACGGRLKMMKHKK